MYNINLYRLIATCMLVEESSNVRAVYSGNPIVNSKLTVIISCASYYLYACTTDLISVLDFNCSVAIYIDYNRYCGSILALMAHIVLQCVYTRLNTTTHLGQH